MTLARSLAVASLLTLLTAAPGAEAQCDEQQLPWPVELGAGHGTSVAISRNVVVIGAPLHSQPGLGAAGAVTVASHDGLGNWSSTQLPLPTLLGPGDRFGHAVAIDPLKLTIAVGAPFNDTLAPDGGLVCIYNWDSVGQTWQLILEAAGVAIGGAFGGALDLSLDRLAVGEPGGAFGAGAVLVYLKTGPTTWALEDALAGTQLLEGFGWAVAVDGQRLLVGSPFYDHSNGADAGMARFYRNSGSGWGQVTAAQWSEADAQAGSAVALSGDNALIGVPGWDAGAAIDAGSVAAYFWTTSGWINLGGLVTLGSPGDRYGAAVALEGSSALIGAPGSSAANGTQYGTESGKIDSRQMSSGFLLGPAQLSTATDVAAGDHYGSAVALEAPFAVVGAPDAGGAGKAYAYNVSIAATVVDHGNALSGSQGLPALSISGPCCGNTGIGIHVTHAQSFASATMVIGMTSLFATFKGGVMVPNPDAIIGPLTTDTWGTIDIATMWPPGLPAFSLWMQFWIADAAGPVGFAATNGVEVQTPGG